MVNLSELTSYYIGVTFNPDLRKVIYQSFSLLEAFGIKYYEDKYIELIQRDDSITSETKSDSFLIYLISDILDIIEEHSITISRDYNPTLNEVNEIAHFLYIIQNLEDYSLITYRLYAEDTPRNILIDLIDYLTLLERPRLYELIEEVDEKLVISLQNFIMDNQDEQEVIDNNHLENLRLFFSFIENTDCLGLEFFDKGYLNVTLDELANLSRVDIAEYIDKTIVVDDAQAGLDCLSILLLCKDTYEIPILKFKQNSLRFTSKLDNVTKLEAVMLSMLNDFNMFKEVALKRQEISHDDQTRVS